MRTGHACLTMVQEVSTLHTFLALSHCKGYLRYEPTFPAKRWLYSSSVLPLPLPLPSPHPLHKALVNLAGVLVQLRSVLHGKMADDGFPATRLPP